MGQPSQKTEFTDEDRALGVDENGGELSAEQRKNPGSETQDSAEADQTVQGE